MVKKVGRPKSNKSATPATSVLSPTTPSASTIAQNVKPPARNSLYHLKNGFISEHIIFMYVPEETLPAGTRNRFLMLCDSSIESLGPETVNMFEVEEVAQLYRDTLQADEICKLINDLDFDRQDPQNKVLLDHYDKLNKQIEKRKENLNIRTRDRKESRNLSKSKTMLDLLDESKVEDIESSVKELAEIYNRALNEFQSLEDYMEPKLLDALPGDKD